MSMQTKVIGRQPTDHGPYDPQLAYGKKFQCTLFGCAWESLHDNNNTAPAVWDGGDTITPNLVDWKKQSGSYESWLMNRDKPASTGTTGDYPYNGLGRIVLKKKYSENSDYANQPILEQADFDDDNNNHLTNTVFVIKYDFVLTEDIELGSGCVLCFEGGSLNGSYTITGNNTLVSVNGNYNPFIGITQTGTFSQLNPSDKPYMSGNGMGKIYLKKNIPFASQLIQTNTVYVIQYDFELTENVAIPVDCILLFDGGTISGAYTITGQNTKIFADKKAFDNNVLFAGTWNCSQIESYWWDIRGNDDTFDNAPSLQKGIDLAALNNNGLYHISGGLLYVDITKVDKTDTNWSTKYGTLQMKSGVHVVVDSGTTIKAMNNTETHYTIFMFFNIQNSSIEGGSLKGDVDTNAAAKSGEWGYGIAIFSANNITIKNVNLSYFNGDGIMIGRTYDLTTYPADTTNFNMIPHNIFISGCDISYNGRQGISVCGLINGVISDCYIHDVAYGGYDTPPRMAIDIEPNGSLPDEKVDGLLVDSIKTRHNSTGSITVMGHNSLVFPGIHNIRIVNCDCADVENYGLRLYNAADTKVSDSLFGPIIIEDTYDKTDEGIAPTIISNCYTNCLRFKKGANTVNVVNTNVYGDFYDSCVSFLGNNSYISLMNCAFYQMDTREILRYVDEDEDHNAMTYDHILYLNCSFGCAYNSTIDSTHATYVNNAVGVVRRLR